LTHLTRGRRSPIREAHEESFERLHAVSYDFTSQRTQEGI